VNKETENRRNAPLATAPGEGSGVIGEARALFDQLAGEVTRHAEQDRAAVRVQGPVAKVLLTACFIAGVLAAATLFYGVLQFPDAPIRESRSGYVGKTGKPHTRQHYDQFLAWKKWMAATFGLAFLTGFAGAAAMKVDRLRRDRGI
jgi:glycine cleavage system aminomethyltransferase T